MKLGCNTPSVSLLAVLHIIYALVRKIAHISILFPFVYLYVLPK